MSTAVLEARRPAIVAGPGEGKPIHVLGGEVRIKIASSDTQNTMTVFEGDVAPLTGPPLHRHPHQDELWQVLEGEFRFVVDGQEIRASAGNTVFAARGTAHTFQNVGTAPGLLLTTVVPGGLDEFFAELEEVAPKGTAPDPRKLLPVFDKYGLELLGPPLGV